MTGDGVRKHFAYFFFKLIIAISYLNIRHLRNRNSRIILIIGGLVCKYTGNVHYSLYYIFLRYMCVDLMHDHL